MADKEVDDSGPSSDGCIADFACLLLGAGIITAFLLRLLA
jgi:hypothetical protein